MLTDAEVGATKRRDLIRALHDFGFSGPYSATNHPYKMRGEHKVHIPNEHEGDIGVGLLDRRLSQAGIDRDDLERI